MFWMEVNICFGFTTSALEMARKKWIIFRMKVFLPSYGKISFEGNFNTETRCC